MPSLRVVYDGTAAGCFEWSKDSVIIGRDCRADIDLSGADNLQISRSHARIELVDGRYEIRDVGAKNAILLNGSIVTRHELSDGDEIELGGTKLIFSSREERVADELSSNSTLGQRTTQGVSRSVSALQTTAMPPRSQPADLSSLRISQQRLLMLYDLSRQFYASDNIPDLLQKILSAVCRLTAAERAFAAVFQQDLREVALVSGHNLVVGRDRARWPISSTIVEEVVRNGRSLMTDDALIDSNLSQAESIRRLRVRSVVSCPLAQAGGVVGLIYADNPLKCAAFNHDDLDLLRALSFHVEAALTMAESRQELSAQNARLQRENLLLSGTMQGGGQILGDSQAIQAVLNRIRDIAEIRGDAQVGVLLTGETGTGKEMFARAIHAMSPRADRPLVTVNSAAIPDSLVEAELFGIESGVATGVSARPGRFELADGGILFLDEIADMSLLTQAKVLRAIQNRSIVRVGGKDEIPVDVWVLAATNKDLQEEVETGRFRRDLYYRLKVLELYLPPLRERGGDVRQLATFFLGKYSQEFGKQVREIEPEAMAAIASYSWPGNVRELENTIAGCVAFCHQKVLGLAALPPQILREKVTDEESLVSLEEMEKRHLVRVLAQTGWNISKTADILQIGRQAVYQKIEKHRLKASFARE